MDCGNADRDVLQSNIRAPPSAPQGRNFRAQGNALGPRDDRKSRALKGRNNLLRPFRARFWVTLLPRAVPWALKLRPCGDEEQGGRHATTMLTSFLGTTITLRTCFPSI